MTVDPGRPAAQSQAPSEPPRTSIELWGALVGLLLATASVVWARTRGLDYLLPHLPEPGSHVAEQLAHPGLLDRLIAAWPGPPATEASPSADPLAEHLARAAAPWVQGRTVVAWCSALAVPATFWIALSFVRPWTALLAALLAGASFLSLQFSGQARPHGLAAGLIPLAVAAAGWMRRRPTPLAYLVAGTCAGLALGSLQIGVAVLPSLLAADLLRERRRERGGAWKRLLPLAALGVACYVFYFDARGPGGGGAPAPGASAPYPRVEEGVLRIGARALTLADWGPGGFGRVVDLLRWNDPLLLWGGLTGIVLAVILRVAGRAPAPAGARPAQATVPAPAGARPAQAIAPAGAGAGRALAVVLAHALPYLAVLGLWEGTADRFLLPLVPYLALSTAFALGWIVERFTTRITPSIWQRALFGLPFWAAALAVPVTYDARFLAARAAPDSLELAAAWLRRSVGPADRILTSPGLDLPLLGGSSADLPDRPSLSDAFVTGGERGGDARAAVLTPDGALDFVESLEADWFVLEVSPRARAALGEPGHGNLRQALFATGRRVERIRPRESGPDAFYYYQDAEELGRQILRTRNLGPELEIWRLERP